MKVIRKNELVEYHPAGHYQMSARRAHSRDVSGSELLTIGRSEFLPGGGAEASAVKPGMELVYYVLDGTLTVTCEGTDQKLSAGDSVLFKAGEVRSVRNDTDRNASMLVISSVR